MVRRDVEAGGGRRKSRDALTSRPEIERLLHAASAPASPRELAGEDAAVDLFAHARLPREAAVVAAAPVRSPRTGLKAAAASAAAVVAMSSGVAFAATGHVPFADTLKQVTRSVTGQGSDGGSDAHHDNANGPQKVAGDSAGPTGPQVVALHGLCRAYAHGQKVTHGHALDVRPFTALVEAAGGADQVDDFCASLPPVVEGTDPSRAAHATPPTTGPNGEPTDHPTAPGEPTQATEPTRPSRRSQPTHEPTPTEASDPTRPTRPTTPDPSQKTSQPVQPRSPR